GASYKAAEHSVSLISGGLLAVIVLAVLYRVVRGSRRMQDWAARQGGRLFSRRRGGKLAPEVDPATAEAEADEATGSGTTAGPGTTADTVGGSPTARLSSTATGPGAS